MSLMSAFYVANSGMASSQNSLNTVAHNLSNVNTKGYTRQQIVQTDSLYNRIEFNMTAVANKQIGLGSIYAITRQVRDVFLDESYRQENGRSAFYNVSYQTMEEVETLLGEMEGATFSGALHNLWVAVEELYKDPASSVTQNLLVQRAQQFTEASVAVYKGLSNYQDNLNTKVQQKVNEVNACANKINELNHRIVQIETGGIEHANDLRDERNKMLDQLGELGMIEYREDPQGYVSVKFEGNVLVNEAFVDEIGLYKDPDTNFFTPYWTREAKYEVDKITWEKKLVSTEGALLFDLNQVISTQNGTDIGSLKSTFFARGDHRADYTDIEDSYHLNISQSILMNVQAEYDQLIHNVVTAVNKVLYHAADESNGYMCDRDSKPLELFKRVGCDTYDSFGRYVEENKRAKDTLYNCMNIEVNKNLLQTPSLLGFVKEDGTTDFTTAQELLDAFTYDKYRLNPNVQTTGNFENYYSNLVSQIGNSGAIFKGVLENQVTTTDAIEAARDQIMGVSSDEELSSMIRFQNAYNANSRYFNVINEMLEHLLSSLGM